MPKGHFSEKHYPLCTVMSLCSFAGTAHLSVHTASRRLVGVGGGYFSGSAPGRPLVSHLRGGLPRRHLWPATRSCVSVANFGGRCIPPLLCVNAIRSEISARCPYYEVSSAWGVLFTPSLPFAVYVSSLCADLLTFVKDTECPRDIFRRNITPYAQLCHSALSPVRRTSLCIPHPFRRW